MEVGGGGGVFVEGTEVGGSGVFVARVAVAVGATGVFVGRAGAFVAAGAVLLGATVAARPCGTEVAGAVAVAVAARTVGWSPCGVADATGNEVPVDSSGDEAGVVSCVLPML